MLRAWPRKIRCATIRVAVGNFQEKPFFRRPEARGRGADRPSFRPIFTVQVLLRGGELDPQDVFHGSVQPCADKKLEAARKDLWHAEDPSAGDAAAAWKEIDVAITSGELLALLRDLSGDAGASDGAFAAWFQEQSRLGAASLGEEERALLGMDGEGRLRSAVARNAGSGGYAEFVFRHAARELFGVALEPDAPLPWRQGRNADMQVLELHAGGAYEGPGKPLLSFARAYGFRNIQGVLQGFRRGGCAHDYVEVMACPGGCTNGGGLIREAPIAGEGPSVDAVAHDRSVDAGTPPIAQRLRSELRPGALTTTYHAVAKLEGALRW